MKHSLIIFMTATVVVFAISGCRTPANSPYKTPREADRSTTKAERLTKRAARLMEARDARSLAEAEGLLRQALSSDLYHGPAHNNLGVIYLGRGDLYEAANEFEWARKLMPGHPDPRTNLAITLEHAGRFDEAIETYRTALEVRPGDLAAIMGLTWLEIDQDIVSDETRSRLSIIASRAVNEEWQEWAKRESIRLAH